MRKYEFLGATVKTQAVSKMSESSGYMMLRMKPILPNGCSRNCNSSSCKEKKWKVSRFGAIDSLNKNLHGSRDPSNAHLHFSLWSKK